MLCIIGKGCSEFPERVHYSNGVLTYIEQINNDWLNGIIPVIKEKTNKNVIVILNNFLKFAHKKGYLDTVYSLPTVKAKKKKIEVLKEDEQERLFCYLTEHFTNLTFGILLSLYTGIRIGELCALQFKDIQQDILSVKKTLLRIKCMNNELEQKTKILIDLPKSESSIRDIPLPPFLCEKIMELNKINENSYILTGSNQYIEPRILENKFKRILQICNIEHRSFHILRHTFATNIVKRKLDYKVLSEILGHSSIKITLDLYVHIDIETKTDFMNQIIPTTKKIS